MNTSLARINAAAERGQMRDQVIAPILAAVRRLRMGRDPARPHYERIRVEFVRDSPDVDTVAGPRFVAPRPANSVVAPDVSMSPFWVAVYRGACGR
jgi:hypothetical protein